MNLFPRIISAREISTNTDQVIGAVVIPTGGKLWKVWGFASVLMASVDTLKHCMYGLTGMAVSITDPDSAQLYDSLWDTKVPKDVDEGSGAYDLDTAATDATPEFEVGEPNLEALVGSGGGPIEFWRRRKVLDFASGPGKGFESGSPDTFYPSDAFPVNSKRSIRASVPTAIMFGFSSPVLDDTVDPATSADILGEADFSLLRFAGDTLKFALMELIGRVESGAETPFTEAASMIADYLEGPAWEDTSAIMQSGTYNVHSKFTFGVSVPGTMNMTSLSSEG